MLPMKSNENHMDNHTYYSSHSVTLDTIIDFNFIIPQLESLNIVYLPNLVHVPTKYWWIIFFLQSIPFYWMAIKNSKRTDFDVSCLRGFFYLVQCYKQSRNIPSEYKQPRCLKKCGSLRAVRRTHHLFFIIHL